MHDRHAPVAITGKLLKPLRAYSTVFRGDGANQIIEIKHFFCDSAGERAYTRICSTQFDLNLIYSPLSRRKRDATS